MQPPRQSDRARRGFTLIEMMAVVLIIGMLSVLFGTVVVGRIGAARVTTARAAMTKVEQALEFYRLDNARYPSSEQGLTALLREPSIDPLPRNYQPEGYLRAPDLVDPWGEDFGYEFPGAHNTYSFDLWSYGADNVSGGEGTDADLANWTADSGAAE
jgi:general secretion pathway protein G